MKNKSMTDLRLVNILLIFGTIVALLGSTSSPMIWASVDMGSPGPNTSSSNQSAAEGCSHEDPRCNTDISCELNPNKCAGQSQGSSQGVASGSNTFNSNQGDTEGLNPCITDPNRCKPPGDASDSSQGQVDGAQCIRTNPHDPPCPPVSAGQSRDSSQGAAPDSSSSPSSSPNQEAINHINQAQSALQNGDTAGAQMHMDSAKQALICNPGDPTHC